jgi:iron(III) transport system ATP-binding protein
MNVLELCQLSKSYEAGQLPAVADVSFAMPADEILAVVGPSGCGKTTTLRLIAGFEIPDRGVIRLKDRPVAADGVFVPPERRGVSMVFQDHALFPHLTVFQNVAFGLKSLPRAQSRERALEMLRLIDMEHLAGRYPHELSGGERQRVALARALAPQPTVVLFDEPFSNLDADRRNEVRAHVRTTLKKIGATAIFVTHDQEEALFMGDRLAVLSQGRLVQIGAPDEVFHAPRSRFVAEFLGNTDFLPGHVTRQGIHTEIGLLAQPVDLPDGEPVEVALRADDVDFEPQPDCGALVVERVFRGAYQLYTLRLPSGCLVHTLQPHTRLVRPGTPARVFVCADHPLILFHRGMAVGLPDRGAQPSADSCQAPRRPRPRSGTGRPAARAFGRLRAAASQV